MSGFFVPHDLKAPLKGAASGPLAGLTAAVKDMYDIAGERTGGGNPDWLAQAQARGGARRRGREAARRRRDHHRQDDLRRILLQRRRHERALRHAARTCARRGASPAARRADRRRRPRPAPAISRSAPTPAARCASRPRSAGSTASAPRTAASTPRARWTCRRRSTPSAGLRAAAGVFRNVGAVLLGGGARRRADRNAADRRRRLRRSRRAGRGAAAATRSTAMAGALPKPQHDPHRAGRPRSPGATRCGSSRPTRSGRSTAASSQEKQPQLRPGRRRAHEDRLRDHQGARPTPRARCTPPRASTSAR